MSFERSDKQYMCMFEELTIFLFLVGNDNMKTTT